MWKVCWNKGRLCWKIAKLFYFCDLKKLVRPETFGPYYVCKDTGVKTDKHWYDHRPKSVETSHEVNVTILWNKQVRADRTPPSNILDVIVRDNKHGTCILTHVPCISTICSSTNKCTNPIYYIHVLSHNCTHAPTCFDLSVSLGSSFVPG